MAKKNDSLRRSKPAAPILQWTWTGSIFTITSTFVLGVLAVLTFLFYQANSDFVLKIDATWFFILLSLLSRSFEGVVTQVTEIKRYDVSNTSDGVKVSTSYRLLTSEGSLNDFWQSWSSGLGMRTQIRIWTPALISVVSTFITAYAFKAAFTTGSAYKFASDINLANSGGSTLLAEAHSYYSAGGIGGLPSGNINYAESPLFWRDKDGPGDSTIIYFSNTLPNLPDLLEYDQEISINRAGYQATTKCNETKPLTPEMQNRFMNGSLTVQKNEVWLSGPQTEVNATIAMEAAPIDNTFRTYYVFNNDVRTCVTSIKGAKVTARYRKDRGLTEMLISEVKMLSEDATMSGYIKPAGNTEISKRMQTLCQRLLDEITAAASLRNNLRVFKGLSSSVNSRVIACGLQAIVSAVSDTSQVQYQRAAQDSKGEVVERYSGIAFSSRWWLLPAGLVVLMFLSALGRLLQGAQRLNINIDRRWLVNVESAEQCLKMQDEKAGDQALEIRGKITDGVQHLVVTPADYGVYSKLTVGRATM